jgi:hypothetical protein
LLENASLLVTTRVKKVEKSEEPQGTQSIFSELRPSQSSDDSHTSVLIVSNLPETTPQKIFRLFGLYGNVMRVKIMNKATNTGLVEFESSH